jgi:hypothetical protein
MKEANYSRDAEQHGDQLSAFLDVTGPVTACYGKLAPVSLGAG